MKLEHQLGILSRSIEKQQNICDAIQTMITSLTEEMARTDGQVCKMQKELYSAQEEPTS